MILTEMLKIKMKSTKRLGRGIGSGRGKTSGRGQKGQKARGTVPAWMIGGSLPLYKKLPLNRGWGNKKVGPKPVPVALSELNSFSKDTTVTLDSLVEKKIISIREAKQRGVKIINKGELSVTLTVMLPVTQKVQEKIEQSGGKVG
jgi:large subunit ribosomal protein L15